MNELKVFEKDGMKLEVWINNEKEYFPAKECAEMLGYVDPLKAVNTHCKKDGWANRPVIDSLGRTQQKKYINEGNLYRLVAKSELPDAEKFESWIFDEVLPSIRKHGGYLTQQKIEEALLNPDTIIKLATDLKEERIRSDKLKIENKQKDQIIGELKPKADYVDRILQSKSLVSITQIAKDYGISGEALNKKLHELKIQYKLGEQWLLYAGYHGQGYTHSDTFDFERKDGTKDVKMNTKWTQKGRLFLYNILKENQIVPVIEK